MSTVRRARAVAGLLSAAALVALSATPVFAHASVPDGKAVPSDGSAVIHVRLPHGCDGAAITAVAVQLPDGVVGAKPELVAGWTVETEMVPATYTLFGTDFTERVGTVTWTGGPLADNQFLDFGISATFMLEPGEYPLPVIQYCGEDSIGWIEVPAAGQSHDDLEHPAPTFTVVEAAASGHDHGATESAAPSDGHTDGTTDSASMEALEAELAAVKAQVTALESDDAAPVAADQTPVMAMAVVGLLAGLGGLLLGGMAVRRKA